MTDVEMQPAEVSLKYNPKEEEDLYMRMKQLESELEIL
jgi:hypothetical protein